MARGFESKNVEYQQEEAARGRTKNEPLSAEQKVAIARRRTLELALARAEADLASATAPAHKRMLEQAIVALNQQLVQEAAEHLLDRRVRSRLAPARNSSPTRP